MSRNCSPGLPQLDANLISLAAISELYEPYDNLMSILQLRQQLQLRRPTESTLSSGGGSPPWQTLWI